MLGKFLKRLLGETRYIEIPVPVPTYEPEPKKLPVAQVMMAHLKATNREDVKSFTIGLTNDTTLCGSIGLLNGGDFVLIGDDTIIPNEHIVSISTQR